MKKIVKLSVIFAVLMFFAVGCGGSSSNSDNSDSGDTADTGDTAETADTGDTADTEAEAELAYPEVDPMAKCNKEGAIAQNVIINDDQDVEHQLAEWYQKNDPSSKLIWLIFTTYDCAPCHLLKQDLLEINQPELRDQGLKILLVLNGSYTDGPQIDREPERVAQEKDMFLTEYPETGLFEIYGYLKEQKIFRKYTEGLIGASYPTYVFIDASTMEILEYGQGWGDGLVESTESKIKILLEEL